MFATSPGVGSDHEHQPHSHPLRYDLSMTAWSRRLPKQPDDPPGQGSQERDQVSRSAAPRPPLSSRPSPPLQAPQEGQLPVMPHLVVDISGHGFGHAGQVAPVLRALAARLPDLRLTLRTAVPRAHLLSMLPMPFELMAPPPDVGLAMQGPVAVDREASSAAYAALHRDWPAVVAREAAALARLRPDLLLSDVGYVGLAAAATEKIQALALCSLNWADVTEAFSVATPEAVAEMRLAYRSARLFLQATPHMPMTWLERRRPIGPDRAHRHEAPRGPAGGAGPARGRAFGPRLVRRHPGRTGGRGAAYPSRRHVARRPLAPARHDPAHRAAFFLHRPHGERRSRGDENGLRHAGRGRLQRRASLVPRPAGLARIALARALDRGAGPGPARCRKMRTSWRGCCGSATCRRAAPASRPPASPRPRT